MMAAAGRAVEMLTTKSMHFAVQAPEIVVKCRLWQNNYYSGHGRCRLA